MMSSLFGLCQLTGLFLGRRVVTTTVFVVFAVGRSTCLSLYKLWLCFIKGVTAWVRSSEDVVDVNSHMLPLVCDCSWCIWCACGLLQQGLLLPVILPFLHSSLAIWCCLILVVWAQLADMVELLLRCNVSSSLLLITSWTWLKQSHLTFLLWLLLSSMKYTE